MDFARLSQPAERPPFLPKKKALGKSREVPVGGSGEQALRHLGLPETPCDPCLPFRRRVFVPSYTSRVLLQLWNCQSTNRSGEGCPLWLKVRGKAPPLHNSTALDCREHMPCRLVLELPFWQNWYYVLVEKHPGVSGHIGFQLLVQLKGEWGAWGAERQVGLGVSRENLVIPQTGNSAQERADHGVGVLQYPISVDRGK